MAPEDQTGDGAEPETQIDLEDAIDDAVTSEGNDGQDAPVGNGIEVAPVSDDVKAQVEAILAAGRATPPPVEASVKPRASRKNKTAPPAAPEAAPAGTTAPEAAPKIIITDYKPALVTKPAAVAANMRTHAEMERGRAALVARGFRG